MKKGIILMLICTIFTAFGQFFLKKATSSLVFGIEIFYNYNLFLGLFLYVLGAFLLIFALRFGELNALYPIVSLTFVWVSLLSAFVLYEVISLTNVFGIGVIISGVVFIQRGREK